ncbi:unnamed protein product [Vitrella brassicaformis CCMP3155]|uniref:Uncharacterized protein n=1 Tax=Vitrella brassicaformis (strain CCMP3155) TaxID=1169540 RepID=A0A0G4EZT0_VITBC|nr:unnamed protein product [Vitrella brassicaformis CCMP3155]|eukprot:CEM04545.1 unnamed protein product [Vitrella brassicaformis CCMP3155]
MKSAIAAVCIALVASVCAASDEAFVPSAGRLPTLRSRTSPARSQLEMATKTSAFDSEPGVLPPLGYFDPLNIFTDKDPEDAAYKKWRAIEIKHGRLAMLAVLGYIVPFYYQFPGLLSSSLNLKFTDVPPGIDAIISGKMPAAGIAQILAFQAFLEAVVFSRQFTDEDAEPGDIQPGWWFRESDPAKLREYQDKEINNGRLAQMGILGLVVGDLLSDKPFPFV